MAKSPVNVDSLLSGLLGNLDKGIVAVKVKKEKAAPKLGDVEKVTRRLDKPTLEAKRLVLIVNVHTCENCGGVYESPNKHVLVEKVDKFGSMHRTRFMTQDDIDGLTRVIEFKEWDMPTCMECFASQDLVPVLEESAMKIEQNFDVDSVIAKIFNKEK